jgi:general secretion pathway protein K
MKRQNGAALLAAMLTVTLVATMAAAALWQQWRSVEVETAERTRVQSAWILTGALDWARLILREDARTGGADHLAEPWALPLQEARLSTFLSMDAGASDTGRDAFLSGQISDLQARMNVMNLLDGEQLSAPSVLAFRRLFEQLGLPAGHVDTLTRELLAAQKGTPAADAAGTGTPLMPQRVDQLVWLGLPESTVATLKPYVILLPERTKVNINTASAEVLHASVPGLDLTEARRLVSTRENAHFATLMDSRLPDALKTPGASDLLGVASNFFEVRGRLRLDQAVVEELSVVRRTGLSITTLWRERGSAITPEAALRD